MIAQGNRPWKAHYLLREKKPVRNGFGLGSGHTTVRSLQAKYFVTMRGESVRTIPAIPSYGGSDAPLPTSMTRFGCFPAPIPDRIQSPK